MTVFDGKLYFKADNGAANGNELWVTDGTEGGTMMVEDINVHFYYNYHFYQ